MQLELLEKQLSKTLSRGHGWNVYSGVVCELSPLPTHLTQLRADVPQRHPDGGHLGAGAQLAVETKVCRFTVFWFQALNASGVNSGSTCTTGLTLASALLTLSSSRDTPAPGPGRAIVIV